MKTRLSSVLFLGAILACGGGNPASSDKDAKGGDALADVAAVDLAPPAPTIDTQLSAPEARAGDQVRFECIGSGWNYAKAEVVVALASAGGGGGGAGADPTPGGTDAAEAPDASPGGAPDLALPEGVTRNGTYLTFTRVGVYTVACYAPDADLLDPTPAQIVITPGAPRAVETTVEPKEIKAGEWITITCTAADAYGNAIEDDLAPAIQPIAGITVTGMTARLTKAGAYTVACVVKNTSARDETPEAVTVVPNVPKKIHTKVDPTTFTAGDSADVECSASDFYDNPVTDLPLSLYLPANMQVLGKQITSTVAGLYPVKCVPQNVEWKYFDLETVSVTVVPGNPTVLEVKRVPDKPFYGVGESFQVSHTARDKYGNVVPGAALGPAEIDPPVGIKPAPQNPLKLFLLNAEGKYRMTFRLQAWPEVYVTMEIKVAGSGPLLTILFPERGATLSGKPSVTVMGQVNDDITGLKTFTINGKDALNSVKPDGSFSYILNPVVQGLNVIDVQVENNAGFKTATGRGFYFSYVYYPMDAANPVSSFVKDTVRAFLGKDFIDDGNHDPSHVDDVATLLEQFLAKLNINALIPSPVAKADPYKVYLQNVTFGKPTIKLQPQDGALAMDITIPNLRMDVRLVGSCNFIIDWCPDFDGDINVNQVRATARILLALDPATHQIHASMQAVDVSLDGIDVNVDGIVGWLFDWLIDLLVDSFTGTIEKAIEGQISGMVNDTLDGVFAKFSLDQTVEIPPLLSENPTTIGIMTRPAELDVKPDGLSLGMDAVLYAQQVVPHDIAGSISRSNCLTLKPAPFALPRRSELELGAFDDVLNQALYAVWVGGTINQPIPQKLLAGVDLGQYGVQDLAVTLDFYLPPILTDCPKELPKVTAPGQPIILQAQIGDLYVEADLIMMGNPLHLGAFINAKANVLVQVTTVDGKNLVSISIPEPCSILGRAPGCALKAIDLGIEIVSINEDFPLTKEDLMNIVESQVLDSALAGVVGKELASFEIPAIDLATLVPGMEGSLALSFAIDELFRQDGFSVVGGHLQ